ncbi:Cytochrome P450, E-class, group I [Trema orientale]|uniref:Cytochrome P450, E-class, group I n=1 Tax=Trema orientale TaxID=63057 RepID=A0A2P5EQV6_TREOI|nr:Cytochrome P450, E-class, group I [Trema orientale]
MVDLQGYLVPVLVCLVSAIVVRAILTKSGSKLRPPPSPFALPIIGHLHLLYPKPHVAFYKLSKRYGPLIQLSLGSKLCVVVSSPEVAKECLQTHEASFLNRPRVGVVEYLYYPSDNFSFASFGPYWKFMKKLCMSRLLGGHTLDQLLSVRREELKNFLTLVQKRAESKESIVVGKELAKLSNNIISRMLMGQNCSEDDSRAEEIRKMIKVKHGLLGKFNLSDYFWLFKNLDVQGLKRRSKDVHDKLDAMMEDIIVKREELRKKEKNRGVKDLVDILIEISEDEKSEIKLSRTSIKSFVMDIFEAGTDTIATTTEWALAELINHPNFMKKAVEEIDTVVGKTKLVQESDIANLPYLQAIIKETLRLHPPSAFLPRESSERRTINGYDIPEKTWLFINAWAIARDPKYWEDPLEFKPERFLREEGSEIINQLDVRGQHFQLLPFGSGRRGCPGTTLALQVIQSTFASMLQCFEWKLIGGKDGLADMEETPGLTLVRVNPLICVPVARRSPSPI